MTKQVASLGHLFLLLQISSPDVFTSMLFILCVPHHLDRMFVEKLTLKPGTSGAAGRVRDQIWPWGTSWKSEILRFFELGRVLWIRSTPI